MSFPRPITCQGCPLYDLTSSGFSRPEGEGTLGVLIVGESLGEQEEKDGLPFRPYAPAGSILERAIQASGYQREQLIFWNICACRPPNNALDGEWYERAAVEHCQQHFKAVVSRFRPRVILALGNVPTRALTGLAGRYTSVSHIRGFCCDSPRYPGIFTIPSFHPSFIARGARELIPVLVRDIQFAVQVANQLARGEWKYDEPTYTFAPDRELIENYLRELNSNAGLALAYDIETDYGDRETDEAELTAGQGNSITQIQFAIRAGDAIVLPWREPYRSWAGELLRTINPKWGWNSDLYDRPLLKAHGCEISGDHIDLMDCWHHYQPDLPRNLQFATSFYWPCGKPWKHRGTKDLTYGGSDVDALIRIGSQLFDDLRSRGVYDGWKRQVKGLRPLLDKMSLRGLPVDTAARETLRTEIEAEQSQLWESLQARYPQSLKGIHPKGGYKILPKELREYAKTKEISGPRFIGLVADGDRACIDAARRYGFGIADCLGHNRLVKVKDFLPNSSPQLLAYIKHKGHPVPRKLKEINHLTGEAKETTEKKEILRLWQKTGDDFYKDCLTHRELGKIRSTYIDGWKVAEDGRVHSTFTFAPATGQLSSRAPNTTNVPRMGKLADAFRRTIAAREGYKLIEFDLTSAHALTLGYLAKDPDYMRIARLDLHSYLTGHMLHMEGRDEWLRLPNDELAAILAQIKKDHKWLRDKRAKPTALGYGFGLGATKLYDFNIESFRPDPIQFGLEWNLHHPRAKWETRTDEQHAKELDRVGKREAAGIIRLLDSLFPRTAAYRTEIKLRAHEDRRLVSPFGYHRWFWDVQSYQQISDSYLPKDFERVFTGRNGKRYKLSAGEDAEAAIAFLPANLAFGHLKEIMLRLEEMGANEKYGLTNQIHDSILYECADHLVDECIAVVSQEMERRSTILVDPVVAPKGLACGIEASVGQNWHELRCVYKSRLEDVI